MSDLNLPEPPPLRKWVVKENVSVQDFDYPWVLFRPIWVMLVHASSGDVVYGTSAFNTPKSIRNATLRLERKHTRAMKRRQYVGSYSRKDEK
jgi:hypothetical protein